MHSSEVFKDMHDFYKKYSFPIYPHILNVVSLLIVINIVQMIK